MSPRTRDIRGIAPAVAAIGLLAATLGVADRGSQLAVPVLGVAGLLLTVVIARLQRDPEDSRFLLESMLWGIGIRLLLFAVIQRTVGPYVFAPDQRSYELLGRGVLNAWQGLSPMPTSVQGSLQVGYPYLNGLVFLLFGPALAGMAIVNVFLGCWIAVPAYHLGRLTVRDHRPTARWIALLTLFFPSLILWSVLNIREAPTILLIVLAVYFFARFQRRGAIWDVIGAVVFLSLIVLFREYLFAIVGTAALMGMLTGKSRHPVRSLVLGGALLVTLIFLGRYTQVGGNLADEPTLSTIEYLRQDLAFGAGSAYGQGYDVSTPGGAIAFLPVGGAYFLLAPFPWAVRSALQAVTVPEMLLWYLLIPLGFRGVALALRYDPRAYTVPAAVLVVVAFAYMLVEGNVGTAYRHRAQILPLAFVFCAVGLQDWLAGRAERRKARRQQRGRATDQLPLTGTASGRRPG